MKLDELRLWTARPVDAEGNLPLKQFTKGCGKLCINRNS